MTVEKMLIQGGTKEQRLQEVMKKVVKSLVETHTTWEGHRIKAMKKNTHVLFVTQTPYEDYSARLKNTLNELERNAATPEEKDFFAYWRFRKEQSHKNSLVHVVTLNELAEKWKYYTHNTGFFFKYIITDSLTTHKFLEDSGLAAQLFSTRFDTTHLVTTANTKLIKTYKDFMREDFKTVLTLCIKDNDNKHAYEGVANKEKAKEKQATEEKSNFEILNKDFDNHVETLKELTNEQPSSLNEYLNTLNKILEGSEAPKSTETNDYKLRMFTLIEECRQFAESAYNPDANYTFGYMEALRDLEQKLKNLT